MSKVAVCIVDGVEFESKRADAKYCSQKCQKAAKRGIVGVVKTVVVDRDENVAVSEPFLTKDKPYDREAAMAGFQKMGLGTVEWITTGIPELDAFQKIPRGRITEIFGPFASGKTTLCLNMIKGLKHKKVLYIDTEASLNPALLLDMELDPKTLHVWNESAHIEDMYEQVIAAADSEQYDLVIVDSLAACTTKVEEQGDVSAHNIGQKAKIVNKLMRVAPMKYKNTDTALVIINQERDVIGSYAPMKYTPGGRGPEYHASLRIRLKSNKSWRFPEKPKDGLYKGQKVEVEIVKSKVSTPWRKQTFKLLYPSPIQMEEVDPTVKPAF